MARPAVSDPLRNFKFKVQISPSGSLAKATGGGIKNLGFSVVSGISVTNETIAYREGGMNTHPHKMIGQSDFTPVTFSKGVFANENALYNWQTFLHSWTQGSNFANGSQSGNGRNDYRCDITVTVYDHPVSNGKYATPATSTAGATPAGDPKLGFKLFNCWPSSWSMTDLNAGDSSILIQQLVVVHEGFQVLWAPSASGKINVNTLANLS